MIDSLLFIAVLATSYQGWSYMFSQLSVIQAHHLGGISNRYPDTYDYMKYSKSTQSKFIHNYISWTHSCGTIALIFLHLVLSLLTDGSMQLVSLIYLWTSGYFLRTMAEYAKPNHSTSNQTSLRSDKQASSKTKWSEFLEHYIAAGNPVLKWVDRFQAVVVNAGGLSLHHAVTFTFLTIYVYEGLFPVSKTFVNATLFVYMFLEISNFCYYHAYHHFKVKEACLERSVKPLAWAEYAEQEGFVALCFTQFQYMFFVSIRCVGMIAYYVPATVLVLFSEPWHWVFKILFVVLISLLYVIGIIWANKLHTQVTQCPEVKFSSDTGNNQDQKNQDQEDRDLKDQELHKNELDEMEINIQEQLNQFEAIMYCAVIAKQVVIYLSSHIDTFVKFSTRQFGSFEASSMAKKISGREPKRAKVDVPNVAEEPKEYSFAHAARAAPEIVVSPEMSVVEAQAQAQAQTITLENIKEPASVEAQDSKTN